MNENSYTLEDYLEVLIERFHEALEYSTDESYVDELAREIDEISASL